MTAIREKTRQVLKPNKILLKVKGFYRDFKLITFRLGLRLSVLYRTCVP